MFLFNGRRKRGSRCIEICRLRYGILSATVAYVLFEAVGRVEEFVPTQIINVFRLLFGFVFVVMGILLPASLIYLLLFTRREDCVNGIQDDD